ncbi:MAG: glycoside hydrolase family 2 protein [Parafilimonas sp.]
MFSKKSILIFLFSLLLVNMVSSQIAMINIQSRKQISLNGKWNVIIDPADVGERYQVWKEKKPQKKTDFFEYAFDDGPVLNVPGDFNAQKKELSFFEGTVWYRKKFSYTIGDDKRLFIYFGAVNYKADVYLNGEKLGSHEGGFTPFQFEITDKARSGDNSIVVKVNNVRQKNGLPGFGYDWLNYGGITRDVELVETNETYIRDYAIQLNKGSINDVAGWIQLNGLQLQQKLEIQIPELNIQYKTQSNEKGFAAVNFSGKFKLWSPENPKLYRVIVKSETDAASEEIGFRCVEVKDGKVFLNRNPVFLKGVSIHEENPNKGARAYSKEDDILLLNAAKALGCNLVRLVHYPHNEYMVREAEKMGLMVWSELPVYQHIDFTDSIVAGKMERMLDEMVGRDKNRCGVIIWSLSNETYPSAPNRTKALIDLTKKCRALDAVRLITHVTNSQIYQGNHFKVWDTLYRYSDLVSLNEYIGWYLPWQGKPSDTKWSIAYPDKPVFIAEFGGEALYGSKGPTDEAVYWTEAYQAKIYKDQLEMFKTIPNLSGVCPWLLFDYKSTNRLHPVYQKGYNRKGLLSEKGNKKKAWLVMKAYYDKKR